MKVPMRLVESAFYSDAALTVYMKIKALGLRPEGCTAGVKTLAEYLSLSVSTVERGIGQLRAVAPDGITELPESTRRTLPGGRGTTALRRVRPLQPKERFIWLPVHASEFLSPRRLRAYAVIAYAVIQRIPLTMRGLAAYLRHHTGPRSGSAISEESASRIADSLRKDGWVGVDHRAGYQGRHLFEVHQHPVPPVEGPSETPGGPSGTPSPSGRSHDGSGTRSSEGSLASKEDPSTYRPDDALLPPSAGGALQVVDADLRDDTFELTDDEASDNSALRADDPFPIPPQRIAPPPPPSANREIPPVPAAHPPVEFSRTTHAVLEPVRFLLTGLGGYVLRRMAREIDRELADGTTVERLQARLTAKLAGTMVSEIADAGRWLLGVALPRWGCADPACESGVVWHTGQACRACAEIRFLRSRGLIPVTRAGTAPPPPRPCCPTCGRPHRPGNEGECLDCAEERKSRARLAEAPVDVPGPEEHRCSGRDGQCTRVASLDGLCWRCRTDTPERSIPRPRRLFSAREHLASLEER
ncbi:hypothetical protein ABT083_31165 [Streptomyces goshikiensis]|uniref:hypothetical protein n=1 Tax=Streptomyces goshikiensis TaxID=1942 RepID=UPI00331C4B00